MKSHSDDFGAPLIASSLTPELLDEKLPHFQLINTCQIVWMILSKGSSVKDTLKHFEESARYPVGFRHTWAAKCAIWLLLKNSFPCSWYLLINFAILRADIYFQDWKAFCSFFDLLMGISYIISVELELLKLIGFSSSASIRGCLKKMSLLFFWMFFIKGSQTNQKNLNNN